jgi:DNA replication and repair protein RecF
LRRPGTDLAPWNEEAARLGWEVRQARTAALEGVRPEVTRIHREVSGGREEPEIRYLSSPSSLKGGLEGGWEAFRELLERDEQNDRRRGFTLHGPHRDRVSVRLGGRELGDHASQGQQRTFALSLKLALLDWIEEKTESSPAFLLDDPGSELDKRRLGFLGGFLSDWKGQVFIAGVGSDDVPLRDGTDLRRYRVLAGTVGAE